MGYDTEIIKICRLDNGYQVEIYDPPPAEKKAEDKAAKDGKYIPSEGIYKSPWRTLAFDTFEKMSAFIMEKGPNLKPRNFDEDYAKSFNDTVASMAKKPAEKSKDK